MIARVLFQAGLSLLFSLIWFTLTIVAGLVDDVGKVRSSIETAHAILTFPVRLLPGWDSSWPAVILNSILWGCLLAGIVCLVLRRLYPPTPNEHLQPTAR